MLLSLDAVPSYDLNGLGVVAPVMATTSMASTDPATEGGVGASITLQDEAGDLWSSADATTPDGFVEVEGETTPADASNPVIAPGFEDLNYEAMDGLATVPWTADHTIEGKLDASQAWIAYKIPVGPETSVLYLSLDSASAGSSASLRIDQVYLVGSGGGVLAKVAATPTPGQGVNGGRQMRVSLLGAPEDSQLVVRVARDDQPPGSGGGGFEGGPPSIGGESNDFLLNVQRSDPAPTVVEDPTTPPVITAPAWTPGSVAPPAATTAITVLGPAQAAQLVLSGLVRSGSARSAGFAVSTGARFVKTEAEPVIGGTAPSVYLGPLASRGSAPMGPTLATSTDEPTPLIDRESQVVDEALDQIGTDDGNVRLLVRLGSRDGSAFQRGVFAAEGRVAENAGEPQEETIVMPGPGGLPALVSRTGRNLPRAEAVALAAHLQSRSVEEALSAEVPQAPPMADQVAGETRVARAGLATRAAGVIVGLGLATGPLYPDLIALARKHIARAKGRNVTIKRRWPFGGHPIRPVI